MNKVSLILISIALLLGLVFVISRFRVYEFYPMELGGGSPAGYLLNRFNGRLKVIKEAKWQWVGPAERPLQFPKVAAPTSPFGLTEGGSKDGVALDFLINILGKAKERGATDKGDKSSTGSDPEQKKSNPFPFFKGPEKK